MLNKRLEHEAEKLAIITIEEKGLNIYEQFPEEGEVLTVKLPLRWNSAKSEI